MNLTMMVISRLGLFSLAAFLIERNFGLSELIRGYVGQDSVSQGAFRAKSFQRKCLIVTVGLVSMILMIGGLSGIFELALHSDVVGENIAGLRLLQFARGLGIAGETMRQLKRHAH